MSRSKPTNALKGLNPKSAEVDKGTRDGATPLFKAVQHNAGPELALLLLSHRAEASDPNPNPNPNPTPDPNPNPNPNPPPKVNTRLGVAFGGVTPLMVAAWRGHPVLLALLLDHGAEAAVAATGPNGVLFAAQAHGAN